ncbi:hypothetical protein ACTFIY_002867 [Dictyostelium cf. discoideum]
MNKNQKLRSLIVDLEPPIFDKLEQQNYWKSIDFQNDYPLLNIDQRNAIIKTLSAKDYSLIHGMPGTGKTTLVISLIHILWRLGKKVLITSFTHTSLDHLLLKFNKQYPMIEMLRVASSLNQIDSSLHKFTLEKQSFENITQSKQYLERQQLVATSCLGINHQSLLKMQFDYCIIDEASILSQPISMGPILKCKSFVLVGDHHQLPPIVNNKEAGKLGLDISLFKQLSTSHPSSVSNLYHQYRMCNSIMSLSNHLIYNNRLVCGNQSISNLSLQTNYYHHDNTIDLLDHINNWPQIICNPNSSVVFVNTDQLNNSNESSNGDLFYNQTEANIVAILTNCLINKLNINQSQIGIITPIRFQLNFIKKSILKYLSIENNNNQNNQNNQNDLKKIENLDILTIDKFQGKDKDCIIISFVRSNEKKEIGELIKDWKRMNVAFTRAKKKLIFVGSKSSLSQFPFFLDFFEFLHSKDWIYNLNNKIQF